MGGGGVPLVPAEEGKMRTGVLESKWGFGAWGSKGWVGVLGRGCSSNLGVG